MKILFAAALAVLLVAGGAVALHDPASFEGGDVTSVATAEVTDREGDVLGFVVFTEGEVVRIAYALRGLTPGEHGFHMHEKGVCEPPFKSAGGHFNPFGREHGVKNPEGRHAGDLPNIVVSPDGTAAGSFVEPLVTLRTGKNSLFRPGGTAIVIHEGPDDNMSNPAGDAGPRVACGVIRKR